MAKGLTREKLIETALGVVDRDGLGALSMRRLGSELAVDPMAAYRHLPNKEALLDGVMEAILSDVGLDIDESLPWPEQLRAIMRAYYVAMLAHPNAVPLVARRLFTTAGTLRVVQKALEVTTRAGIPAHEASLTITSGGFFLHGLALFVTAQSTEGRGPEEEAVAFAQLPREQFGEFLHALESGDFVTDFDAILDYGLGALIDKLAPSEGEAETGCQQADRAGQGAPEVDSGSRG